RRGTGCRTDSRRHAAPARRCRTNPPASPSAASAAPASVASGWSCCALLSRTDRLLPPRLIRMTPAQKVFVARLVGLAVLGPDGESIGRVRDVVISMHLPGQQPRALGLAVELTTRRRIFVPMLRVTSIEPDAVTLTTGHVNLRKLRVRPNEALAVGQILDTRARIDDPDYPELQGEELTVVDLAIEQNRTRDWMVNRVALRTMRKGLRRRGETIV